VIGPCGWVKQIVESILCFLPFLFLSPQDTTNITSVEGNSTAIYSALLNHDGECVFGLGDMAIHSQISSDLITQQCKGIIQGAPVVMLDGNIPVETISTVLRMCLQHDVPGT
jgi:sugar/nucleoside kinase (ribokinase family)